MEKENENEIIKIDLKHVLDICKKFADHCDENTIIGKAMYEAYMDVYCCLVSTYIYKGW